MNILSAICGQRWAITPDALRDLIAIAQRQGVSGAHFHAAPEALQLTHGEPMRDTRYAERVANVGILSLSGPIFPKANIMTAISDATSIQQFAYDLMRLEAAGEIDQILLLCDSPGGAVTDIADAADLVAVCTKPITAFVSGNACSAAYWIASAADKIVMSQTAFVGSIGVVASVPVQTEADGYGEMTYEIVSSNAPNKRPDPRTDAGQAEIRSSLDAIETLFISAVARGRGVSEQTVRESFGQGGVFIAAEAVSRGMADGIGTFESVLAGLRTDKPLSNKSNVFTQEKSDMTELNQERREVASQPNQPTAEQVLAAERARVSGIQALSAKMPGHDALIASMIADGSSVADAQAKIIDAEAAARPGREALGDMAHMGRVLDASGDAAMLTSFKNLPIVDRAKQEILHNADLREEMSFFPNEPADTVAARYAACLKAESEGRVRILSRPSAS